MKECNLVLFGPPGSGKGTQSEKLIAKYGLDHLSTGDLFRENISHKTELGNLAQKYMNDGNLVPDTVVIDMLKAAVLDKKKTKGFIFDGFPRTILQAQTLDEFLSDINKSVTAMISLEVEEEELTKRLLMRGKTSGRADDQDISKIKNRINVYNTETLPVKTYYKDKNKLITINGIGSIESIFGNICKEIEAIASI